MKKIGLCILFFLSSIAFMNAQLTLVANGDGTVSVTYNVNDLSLYDPGFDDVVIYMWINTDQNSAGEYFQDEWTNAPSLVSLTWNGVDAHVGVIDFNTHDFTHSTGIMSGGTTVNNFYLILRNPNGDNQSVDLLASDYGYTATTTLSVETDVLANFKMYPNPVKDHISFTIDVSEIAIYDATGRLIKTAENALDYNSPLAVTDLPQGVYFVKARDNTFGSLFTSTFIKL